VTVGVVRIDRERGFVNAERRLEGTERVESLADLECRVSVVGFERERCAESAGGIGILAGRSVGATEPSLRLEALRMRSPDASRRAR
jgi:hypothetical protein